MKKKTQANEKTHETQARTVIVLRKQPSPHSKKERKPYDANSAHRAQIWQRVLYRLIQIVPQMKPAASDYPVD